MPIGPYADWDECIRAATDDPSIDDPERYCGGLEQQATGANMTTHVALIAPEEVLTSDRRLFKAGSWNWRETIPMQFTDTTTEGHDGAVHVANATNMRRASINGETWIVGDVTYDNDETAREARRLADEGKIAGLSADYSGNDFEVIFGEREDGLDSELHYTDAEILGVTQLPMPAFAGARIMTRTEFDGLTAERSLVAAAFAQIDDWKPPRHLFEVDEPDEPTFTTVYEDGDYLGFYGHASEDWSQCHIGFSDACVPPPISPTDGAEFNTRPVDCDDGTRLLVGPVTMATDNGGGHADLSQSLSDTVAHYDNANTVIAIARMSNGEFGPWLSGVILPDVDRDQLRRFKLMQLSGDWRRTADSKELDMRACLAVPVGGFGVKARVASGEVEALIAAGPKPPEPKSREDLIYEALRLLTEEVRALRAGGYVTPVPELRAELGAHELELDHDVPIEEARGRIAALLDS